MFTLRLSVFAVGVFLALTFSELAEGRSFHHSKRHHKKSRDTSEESEEDLDREIGYHPHRKHHYASTGMGDDYEEADSSYTPSGRYGHSQGQQHRGRGMGRSMGRSMEGTQDGRSLLGGLGSTLGNLLGLSSVSQHLVEKGTDAAAGLAAKAGPILSNLIQNALSSGSSSLVSTAKDYLSGLTESAMNAGKDAMAVIQSNELLKMAANGAYSMGKDVLENKAADLIGNLAESAMNTNPQQLLAKGDALLQSLLAAGVPNPVAKKESSSVVLADIAKLITDIVKS